MDYAAAVTRGRFLLKRSNEDQWELAELTWKVLKEKGYGFGKQWAADLGCDESHVSRLKAVWERYGRIEHTQFSFTEYYALASVPQEDEKELQREARRTRRSVPTVIRHRRERRAAAREALLDPRQRKEILADANIRRILERELREEKSRKPKPRWRTGYVAELEAIRDQMRQLLAEMLDDPPTTQERKDLLAELVELQEVLVWFQSYVKTGSRNFEDALEAMLAEETPPPPTDRPEPARPPKPAPEPAAEPIQAEPAAPVDRQRPRRRDRSEGEGADPTRRRRRDRKAS